MFFRDAFELRHWVTGDRAPARRSVTTCGTGIRGCTLGRGGLGYTPTRGECAFTPPTPDARHGTEWMVHKPSFELHGCGCGLDALLQAANTLADHRAISLLGQ